MKKRIFIVKMINHEKVTTYFIGFGDKGQGTQRWGELKFGPHQFETYDAAAEFLNTKVVANAYFQIEGLFIDEKHFKVPAV